MIKILTIIGARPQFVKAAVLSKAYLKTKKVNEIIVHTGQHFDKNMSEIFFEEMEIPKPNYQLNINGISHGAMTGRMLEELEKIINIENPNYVVVFGDTNSTLAGALAAKKIGIKVIHVEAGVRNFDEQMPEEINRYLVDRISDFNFCCTYLGLENLRKEGYGTVINNSKIINVGDLMYDATIYYKEKSKINSSLVSKLGLDNTKYIVCTIHRASNTDNLDNLKNIIDALNEIDKIIKVVVPIHPRTRIQIEKFNIKINFKIIEPVGYFDMLNLLNKCHYVITDSGGVVREAYFFNKLSILLLEKPLWPELVEENVCFNTLPQKDKILDTFNQIIKAPVLLKGNIFGDGFAAAKITTLILDDYGK